MRVESAMGRALVPVPGCIGCLDIQSVHLGSRQDCSLSFSRLSSLSLGYGRQKPCRGFSHRGRKPLTVSCSSSAESSKENSDAQEDLMWEKFSIIEGRDTVQDFAKMQMQEIIDNIARRRNKIFLLMEEVRRLRIQQRIKSQEQGIEALLDEEQSVPSAIPFLPPLVAVYGQTAETLKQYYVTFFTLVTVIILFGGLVAPALELKLGLGGTSYADFIRSMHLPMQLSQVDPIVASFSGGAVGVLSALLIVEIKNVEMQEQRRCRYCCGTGYLACARCIGRGALIQVSSSAGSETDGTEASEGVEMMTRCSSCGGAGKVMCPTCLCTGMALATEHDPRIDPFD